MGIEGANLIADFRDAVPCQENKYGGGVVSQKTEDFETLRKAVPATSLFLSSLDPLCHVSRGKTGEADTGKRDYRHRSRIGCV